MVYIYTRAITACAILLLLSGCTKSGSSAGINSSPRVIFTISGGRSDTLSGGNITRIAGGNAANYDTTHGYLFAFEGGNNSDIFLTFEVSQLQNGTFSYKAFSAAWPYPLGNDTWEFGGGTYLDPDSATISLQIDRISNNSVSGEFALSFFDGTSSLVLKDGIFDNLPLRQ